MWGLPKNASKRGWKSSKNLGRDMGDRSVKVHLWKEGVRR